MAVFRAEFPIGRTGSPVAFSIAFQTFMTHPSEPFRPSVSPLTPVEYAFTRNMQSCTCRGCPGTQPFWTFILVHISINTCPKSQLLRKSSTHTQTVVVGRAGGVTIDSGENYFLFFYFFSRKIISCPQIHSDGRL